MSFVFIDSSLLSLLVYNLKIVICNSFPSFFIALLFGVVKDNGSFSYY